MADNAPETSKWPFMVNPEGQTVRVHPEDVQDAYEQGWFAANKDQRLDALKQEKYGGEGSTLKAVGLAAGRGGGTAAGALGGAAVGTAIFPVVGTAIGGVVGGYLGNKAATEAENKLVGQENVQGYQEAHPYASAGTELATSLVGGEGAAVKTMGGLGRLATEGAENVLPKATTVAGKIARAAAKEGVGSSIDAMVWEGNHLVTEDALGNDPDLNAEKVVAHLGMAGIFGGVLGTALGGGMEGAGLALNRARRMVNEAPDAMAGRVINYAKTPEQKAVLEKYWNDPSGTKTFQDAADEVVAKNPAPQDIEDATRGFKRHKNETDAEFRKLEKQGMEWRDEEMATLGREADEKAAMNAHGSAVNRLSQAAEALEQSGDSTVQSTAKKLRDMASKYADKASTDAGENFVGITNMRQEVDKLNVFGRKPSPQFADAAEELTSLRQDLNGLASDVGVWGKAGERLTAHNQAITDLMSANKNVEGMLYAKIRKPNSMRPVFEASAKKVRSYLKNVANSTGEEVTEALEQQRLARNGYLDSLEQMAKNAGKPEIERAPVQGMLDHQKDLITEARQAQQYRQQFPQLEAQRNAQVAQLGSAGTPAPKPTGDLVGQFATHTIGAGIAHAVGIPYPVYAAGVKVAKGLAQVKAEPGVALSRLAALDNMIRKVDPIISRGAQTLVKGGAAAYRATRGQAIAGISRSLAQDPKAQQKTYERRTQQLARLNGSPAAQVDVVAQNIAPVQAIAPKHATALGAAQHRVLGVAAQALPQKTHAGVLPSKAPASRAEMAKFNSVWDVLEEPTSLPRLAAQGTLLPEQVAAVAQAYPKFHQQMQQEIIQNLIEHGVDNVPGKSRMGISLILGAPVDAGCAPEALQMNSAVFAQAPKQPTPQPNGARVLEHANRAEMPDQTQAEA